MRVLSSVVVHSQRRLDTIEFSCDRKFNAQRKNAINMVVKYMNAESLWNLQLHAGQIIVCIPLILTPLIYL